MNVRQRRFVDEYLIDLNATKSAERAGYSAKTSHVQGPRLLGNVSVKAAIEAAQQARSKRTLLTQDWVVERLMENHARAMQVEAVTDKFGNETGEFAYNGNVANKSLELLGKHLAMFTEKHEVSVPQGTGVLAVPIPVTPGQWAEMAAKQQATLGKPVDK